MRINRIKSLKTRLINSNLILRKEKPVIKAHIMSNVAKSWNGRQALTKSLNERY